MFHFFCAPRFVAWLLAIGAQLAGIVLIPRANAGESAETPRLYSQAVFNDFFTSAIKVNAQPVWIHTTGNQAASMEQFESELAHGGEANAAASLWYTWTVRERTELLVDTAGSGFSTAIGIYSGTVLGSLARVAGASSAVQGRDAWVRFTAEPNVSYKIAIAGIPPAPLGALRVRFEAGGQPDLAVPIVEITRPISGTTVRDPRVRIEGTAFDPQPHGSGVREVQYTLSSEADAIIRNAQGLTNFALTVDLIEGLNIVTLWANDQADNRSAERRVSVLLRSVLTTNDLFYDRILLDERVNGRIDFSSGATKEFREPAHAGNPGGASIWYEFPSARSGVLLLSTLGSGFDTVLGIYTSTNTGFPTITNLIELASSDDVVGGGGYSEAAVTVQQGKKYFIAVDGFDGQAGVVQLNYQFSPGPVYELSLQPSFGKGTVFPAGGVYPENATVSIEARPALGSEFDYFETAAGQVRENPMVVVMHRDTNIRAVFRVRTYAEDFEDGLDLPFVGAWTIEQDPTNRFNRVFTAFGNGQGRTTNIVSLTVRVGDGFGGFDFGVSSETNHDRLEFSVSYVQNGEESPRMVLGSWSGELRGRHEFALRSGTAHLEWRFVKDAAVSHGADRAFIDNLDLPFTVVQSSVSRFGENLRVHLSGLGSQALRIESSTDLRNWTPVRTAAPDASGEATFEEPARSGARFYRFVVVPPSTVSLLPP